MKKSKKCLSVLLSFSLICLCSCGTKAVNSDVENESENVVEIDLAGLTSSGNSTQTLDSPEASNSDVFSSAIDVSDETSPVDSDTEITDDLSSESDHEIDENDEQKSKISDKKKNKENFVTKPMMGVPVDDSWFDDCVFIGDSLTLGLSLYNDWMDVFGDAKFVCSAGLNWHNAQWDIDDANAVHPLYNGEKILVEDAINITAADKAIIGFGMNDIAIFGVDSAIEAADELLVKIEEKSPGVQIYLLTVSPMIEAAEKGNLNNSLIREYDDKLPGLADSHGCIIIDSWDFLIDEDGYLPVELCEDPDSLGIHLNNDGCKILSECIKCSVN